MSKLRGRAPNAMVLLVLRLPGFADVAWRRGKRAARELERQVADAFRTGCARTLRANDRIAHDPGTDRFLVALVSPPRELRARSPSDCRCVLERIALEMGTRIGLTIESGWCAPDALDDREALDAAVAQALERGARERERYEFFAAVGHELRTPLTSIRGYLETLLERPSDEATSRRFLETARREALRMGRLLEGMFEFSLLDLSAPPPRQSCDAAQQIDAACDIVAPLADRRSVQIVREHVQGECTAAIGADALLQALINVLENAVKYGGEGGRIRVRSYASHGEVTIDVDDDGPGIAGSDASAIFGFRERGPHAASYRGSGIGLAIVKTLIERSGGSIVCGRSELGGARFRIALPSGAESAAAAS